MTKYKLKFKDSDYLDKVKDYKEEIEHTANYLWTWEDFIEGPNIAAILRDIAEQEGKERPTREEAIKFLDKYFEELKKSVDDVLNKGYKTKLKRLNIIYDKYESMSKEKK